MGASTNDRALSQPRHVVAARIAGISQMVLDLPKWAIPKTYADDRFKMLCYFVFKTR